MVIIEEITPLRTGLQIRLDSGKTVRLTRKDAEEGFPVMRALEISADERPPDEENESDFSPMEEIYA